MDEPRRLATRKTWVSTAIAGMSKRVAENHVGRLPSHTGKLFEGLAVGGHLAVELLKQDAAHLDDVLRLAAKESDLFDLFLQGFVRQCSKSFGVLYLGRGALLPC